MSAGSTPASRRPRISVGMPAYNAERFIAESIETVLAQTFTDLELIISDNASTDRTRLICEHYAYRDSRIRYVRNDHNIGAARNFNRLVQLASAEYFKLANADDLCAPELIERCVMLLDERPEVVLCYGKTTFIDAGGRPIRDFEDGLDLPQASAVTRFRLAIARTARVNALQGVIRLAPLKKTLLMGSFVGSDQVLLQELALYGCFAEIPQRLFYRRLHAAAYSSIQHLDQLQTVLDPDIKTRMAFPLWKTHCRRIFAAIRAPTSLCERTRLLWIVVRLGITDRRGLIEELRRAAGHFTGRPAARSGATR